VTGKDDAGLLKLEAWLRDGPPKERRKMLRTGWEKQTVATLRQLTSRGRPLGSDGFIRKVESWVGRRLRPSPVGRPVGWRKHE
jgi:hypothetical protein